MAIDLKKTVLQNICGLLINIARSCAQPRGGEGWGRVKIYTRNGFTNKYDSSVGAITFCVVYSYLGLYTCILG